MKQPSRPEKRERGAEVKKGNDYKPFIFFFRGRPLVPVIGAQHNVVEIFVIELVKTSWKVSEKEETLLKKISLLD